MQKDTELNKLLSYVVKGEEDQVKLMLQHSPEFLLHKGDITDNSGRHFSNISPFQYALWALDSHLWKTMLSCVPTGTEGNEIRKKLFELYEEVLITGISYTIANNQIGNEHHFDFEPLKTALKTYFEQFHHWTLEQRNDYWRKVVGAAQRNVPAHVAHEYCFPNRSFEPIPQFDESQLPRSLQFYNKLTDSYDDWWPVGESLTKLGVDFAIVGPRKWVDRQSQVIAPRGLLPLASKPAAVDFEAMTILCKVRIRELRELKQLLLDA